MVGWIDGLWVGVLWTGLARRVRVVLGSLGLGLIFFSYVWVPFVYCIYISIYGYMVSRIFFWEILEGGHNNPLLPPKSTTPPHHHHHDDATTARARSWAITANESMFFWAKKHTFFAQPLNVKKGRFLFTTVVW